MDLTTTMQSLVVVLALGTIYAWYQFYKVYIGSCDTCSVGLKASPFKSKCFVGALFFTAAFALSLYALTLL